MCGKSEGWTDKANCAKSIAIATLIFAIVSLLTFVVGGWLAGVGAVLAIVGSSMLICCSGPGKGGCFKGAAILNLIAAIAHGVGAILMILIVVNAGSSSLDDTCVDTWCSNNGYMIMTCDTSLCSSEADCRVSTSVSTLCGSVTAAVAGWVQIVLWPGIILSAICTALELALCINAFQAAPGMESAAQAKAGGQA